MKIINDIEKSLNNAGLNWRKLALLTGKHPRNIKRTVIQNIERLDEILKHAGIKLTIRKLIK